MFNVKRTLVLKLVLASTVLLVILFTFTSISNSAAKEVVKSYVGIDKAEATLVANIEDNKTQMKKELKSFDEDKYNLPDEISYVEWPFSQANEQLREVRQQRNSKTRSSSGISVDTEIYQPGFFESHRIAQWQCAWISYAVKQSEEGNRPNVEKAVSALNSFKEKEEIKYFPDYEWLLDNVINPILDDDISPAKGYLNTCPPETLSK